MTLAHARQLLLACGVWLCCSSIALAQTWQLTTADFQTQPVELQAIATGGAVVVPPGGQPITINYDRLLQLERVEAAEAKPATFVLQLIGGDRIGGEPLALEGEQIRWKSPTLGEMSFPLQQVSLMHRQGQSIYLEESRPRDVITLNNGDLLAGIVSDITPQNITVQSGGQPVAVPLDAMAFVSFATTGAAPAPRERGFRVTLHDESMITASELRTEKNSLQLTFAKGEPRSLPLAQVRRIEQVNGPLVWLSALAPSESAHVPYFTELSLPARFDRSVDGEPIRFDGRTFVRGIGVHSYSRLVWPLDPQYKTFRTQYAIAGDLPYADVTVRVKLDDRVVHEQKNVKSGRLSDGITADLAGAKTLTLEVDYGESYDVQDRLNWIEPALLR